MTKTTTKSEEKQSAPQKMADLLNALKEQKIPAPGELVEGTVINVGKNEVMIDIGGYAIGIVRGKELEDESGEYSDLKIGDKVQATVLELENEKGALELSFRQAGHQKAWDNLERMKKEGTIIKAKIVDANKGGLMCKIGGVVGFMPVSQLTPEHYPRVEGGDKNKILEILKGYVNQEFEVKIIDVDEREEKLILSERAAWEEKQKDIISQYKVGQVVEGVVTGVVDFGAFIEFGEEMEGLIHISELAWQRIDNPRDFIKVGDKVKAKIIDIEGSKISLSIKALQEDPWKNIHKKYKVGDKVKGKVLKLNDFGAFVELDKDIHGLAHISELSDYPIQSPAEVLEIGQTYDFKIVSLEPSEHRLGLSIKALKEKKDKTDKPEKDESKKQDKAETSDKEDNPKNEEDKTQDKKEKQEQNEK